MILIGSFILFKSIEMKIIIWNNHITIITLFCAFFCLFVSSCTFVSGEMDIAPKLKLIATGINKTTNQERTIESISGKTTTVELNGVEYKADNTILSCSPNDVININYHYYLSDTNSGWNIKTITSVVHLFDEKKEFYTVGFDIKFTVPDIPTGQYPVRCKTHSELYNSGDIGGSAYPIIESLFILDINNK